MDLLACGRIGRPHGVRGAVRIWPLNPHSELLTRNREITVGRTLKSAKVYRLEHVRRDPKSFVVTIAGVSSREAAAALTNMTWFEARGDFPDAGDDEVYIVDLIGMAVESDTGDLIGKIVDVWEVGAADVLVIDGPDGQQLVPNVPEFVVRLDPSKGAAIIRPIEGLLQSDESD